MEGKFGTVGAIATAFVFGFQPRAAVVIIKKSEDNSGRKSKHYPQS
ncbi:hypothetical protein NSS79_14365 [Paenibacillus sp. FSL L8-0436]